ncbi:MAG: flagellar motor switch protein FliM [Christensenellales bacterium]
MANILSQNEIDELLSVLTSGKDAHVDDFIAEDPKMAKPYDFRTADKFSKEQIRTLHFIYDNYASRLSTYLSGTLRTLCEVDVISIEEQTFSELSNSMPEPVVVSIINMPPLQGSSLFVISSAISYEIISRLLGGTGEMQAVDKSFTEIELSIMERVIKKVLSLMSEAWERINKISVQLDRVETSSQYVQIVSANEPIAIITMNVKIGSVSDIINICIPNVAVQPIAKQLVMKTWYSEQNFNKAPMNTKELKQGLAGVSLTLYTVFNEIEATVKDILSIQVGDVIKIAHNISMPVTVNIEHIPKFKGFIGMQDSNYAVKVADILREGTEDGADVDEQ